MNGDKITVEFSRAELKQRCKNKEFFRFGAWRCGGCDGSDERLIACHLDFKTSFKINKEIKEIPCDGRAVKIKDYKSFYNTQRGVKNVKF